MPLVEEADRLAHEAHAGQTRRHGAPYISHPRAVLRILDDMAFACALAVDDGVRATALLHDVLEDCEAFTPAILSQRFGPVVAGAVVALTKTGKGDAFTAAYYAELQQAVPSTKLVKICDRLHNLSELHKQPDPQKVVRYVDETLLHVRPLALSLHAGLVAAIDNAIDNARANARANQGLATSTSPAAAGLYAIVSPSSSWQQRLGALLNGGVARVQLRVKGELDDRAWLVVADSAKANCAARGVPLLINDRADLALAAGTGVHLGDRDLPPPQARRMLPPSTLVGTSTHSLAQLQAVDDEGAADHIALGPIWASPTKQTHGVVGVDVLRAACALTSRPVVAIGGVTSPARAAEAARAGATFVAVLSAVDIADVDDLHALARRFALSFAAARVPAGSGTSL